VRFCSFCFKAIQARRKVFKIFRQFIAIDCEDRKTATSRRAGSAAPLAYLALSFPPAERSLARELERDLPIFASASPFLTFAAAGDGERERLRLLPLRDPEREREREREREVEREREREERERDEEADREREREREREGERESLRPRGLGLRRLLRLRLRRGGLLRRGLRLRPRPKWWGGSGIGGGGPR
jgi:hypothetical protein